MVEVLEALSLSPYCPTEHIVVSPKGKRPDLEHWRRWRTGFENAGTPLAAVIDHSEKGTGSVLWPLSNAPDFDDVNLYFWPHEDVLEIHPTPRAILINCLAPTLKSTS